MTSAKPRLAAKVFLLVSSVVLLLMAQRPVMAAGDPSPTNLTLLPGDGPDITITLKVPAGLAHPNNIEVSYFTVAGGAHTITGAKFVGTNSKANIAHVDVGATNTKSAARPPEVMPPRQPLGRWGAALWAGGSSERSA